MRSFICGFFGIVLCISLIVCAVFGCFSAVLPAEFKAEIVEDAYAFGAQNAAMETFAPILKSAMGGILFLFLGVIIVFCAAMIILISSPKRRLLQTISSSSLVAAFIIGGVFLALNKIYEYLAANNSLVDWAAYDPYHAGFRSALLYVCAALFVISLVLWIFYAVYRKRARDKSDKAYQAAARAINDDE